MVNFFSFLVLSIFLGCESNVPNSEINSNSVLMNSKNKIGPLKKNNKDLLSISFSGDPSSQGLEEQKYCQKVDQKFHQYGWSKSNCLGYSWNWVRRSFWGNIIPWVVAGEPEDVDANTTIVLCGVHGDEITPIKFCYDIMEYVQTLGNELRGHRVVIAPLVAPDSFLKKYPTRTNARGVDVNRNFPTKDWDKDALRLWKSRYSSAKRRYPGKISKSEQETHFQINLINRYKPQKIISVHAPLTIIDYDGPESAHGDKEHVAKSLLVQMSKRADGYKVKNYPFFPGSLGNWAGNERGIPTYTLELPTSDNRLHRKHWKKFKPAILYAITHNFNVAEIVEK